MGINFLFDPILGTIYEDYAVLCLFGTVNINKAIIPDKKLFLYCI